MYLKTPKASPDYYLQTAAKHGWGEKNAALDKERLELLKKFTVGKKTLDIGCGYGLYVDFLASLDFDSFGVDFVDDFIKSAQKNRKGTFIKAEAEKLPFKEDSFDTVTLFDILEHCDDKRVLLEAKRVSSENILIIVPRAVDHTLEKSGVIFKHYLDKSHLREYTREDIRKLAGSVGLKVVFIKPVHRLFNETIFSALFNGPLIFKKMVRKAVLLLLPQKPYPTEIFAVLHK